MVECEWKRREKQSWTFPKKDLARFSLFDAARHLISQRYWFRAFFFCFVLGFDCLQKNVGGTQSREMLSIYCHTFCCAHNLQGHHQSKRYIQWREQRGNAKQIFTKLQGVHGGKRAVKNLLMSHHLLNHNSTVQKWTYRKVRMNLWDQCANTKST